MFGCPDVCFCASSGVGSVQGVKRRVVLVVKEVPLRILLIAPANVDLPGLDSEIAAISSFHDVIPVVGIVRETDIAEALSDHPEGVDILWWATHAGDIGVKLSEDILTADGVGQYLTASRARLCVLNTCASEALARQIIVGTDSDLVYTVADLADTDALRFGTLFAGELAKTDNFRKAFDLASPKRGKYKYLAAKAAIRSLDMTVSGELQKLGSRVDETVQTNYQMRVDAKALTNLLAEVKQQLTTMQQEVSILRQQAQTQVMREDLRKEGQNRDIAAMGQRIDNQAQTQPFPTSSGARPVPVLEQARIPAMTWVIVILLVCLLIVGVFFAGRMF